MNVEDHKLTQRVISEVSQIIDMLSQRSKNFIPSDLLNFFKNNAKEIEKYPVDRTIPIDKQDLDKVTYECVSMLMQFIKPIAEYIELEPRWNTIEDNRKSMCSRAHTHMTGSLIYSRNRHSTINRL